MSLKCPKCESKNINVKIEAYQVDVDDWDKMEVGTCEDCGYIKSLIVFEVNETFTEELLSEHKCGCGE